jgi:hypothetical protein
MRKNKGVILVFSGLPQKSLRLSTLLYSPFLSRTAKEIAKVEFRAHTASRPFSKPSAIAPTSAGRSSVVVIRRVQRRILSNMGLPQRAAVSSDLF